MNNIKLLLLATAALLTAPGIAPAAPEGLDNETCLVYQGYVPYHGRELLFGLAGDFVPSLRGVARTLVLVPFRIAINRLARRRRDAHLLYALTPNEATHLEHPVISPDRDWRAVAIEVSQWAAEQGILAPAVGSSSR